MKIVTMYQHLCLRCGGTFLSKKREPVRCGKASCRSPYWNSQRKKR